MISLEKLLNLGGNAMLLNFSVENWKSIKERIDFSMQATREVQHGERLTKIKKFDMRILPNSILFGANASGKSAFVTALEFMKAFIINWNKDF